MVPFPARDEMYFSSPKRPDRFWDQSSLLPSGYSGLIPWGQDGWGVELTTHVHLMPTLRISGAIPHYSTFSGRAQGARPFQFIIHESPCIRRYIYIYIYIYISPEITALDFCLWGWMKGEVNETNCSFVFWMPLPA